MYIYQHNNYCVVDVYPTKHLFFKSNYTDNVSDSRPGSYSKADFDNTMYAVSMQVLLMCGILI